MEETKSLSGPIKIVVHDTIDTCEKWHGTLGGTYLCRKCTKQICIECRDSGHPDLCKECAKDPRCIGDHSQSEERCMWCGEKICMECRPAVDGNICKRCNYKTLFIGFDAHVVIENINLGNMVKFKKSECGACGRVSGCWHEGELNICMSCVFGVVVRLKNFT